MIFDEPRVLILTEDLSKTYKLGNEIEVAVSSLDIRIMQGESIIIRGLRGTQKKAVFNLLGCLESPTAGKYYFDYEDIAVADTNILDGIRKQKIGYLFRDFKLIDRITAAQNIEIPMYGLNISREEKKARLLKSLRSFGIETIAEEKAINLTDYQKQLVSLARAVVNNPLMIIADEPAANLDSQEEQKLMEYLFSLNTEGITIILFTEKETIKALRRYRLISFKAGRVSEDKKGTCSLPCKEGGFR